jgi:hypothetical protein
MEDHLGSRREWPAPQGTVLDIVLLLIVIWIRIGKRSDL